MIIVDLQQGTPEWLEWRKSRVMASDMPIICGHRGEKEIDYLYLRKRGELNRTFVNDAMREGIAKEPVARKLFEAKNGVNMKPTVIASDKVEWAGASLDGLDDSRQVMIEIKCPKTSTDHVYALERIVPDHYMPQLQWQLFCSGLDRMEYVSYQPEAEVPYVQFTVKKDKYIIEEILEKGKWFMECVKDGVSPIEEVWIEDHVRYTKCERLLMLMDEKEKIEKGIESIRKDLIFSFDGKRAKSTHLMFTPVETKGNIQYNQIPELAGVDLDKFRSPSYTKWVVRRV